MSSRNTRQLAAVTLLIAVLALGSCKEKFTDYKSIISNPLTYSQLVHELNTVVMGNNFPPIIASRNYMYAAVAGYEAIAAGDPDQFISLTGQLNGFSETAKPDVSKPINYEYASILAYTKVGEAVTFPAGSMADYIDSINRMMVDHGMPDEEIEASKTFADSIAAKVLAWSKQDHYAETRSSPKYTVMDEPGRWVPTPPMYASAMEPHWVEIRTLVMDSANMFRAPEPFPFNVTDKNSPYYKEVMAIKKAKDSITEEQTHIANFWDDNPFKLNVSGHVMFGTKKFSPPGHWMSIVGIAAKKAGFDFANTTYAYVMTAIAQFDGFIQSWDAKYTYNTIRPETVINKFFDPEWTPLLQTPPFPEYTCGHSTVSSANAEALTKVFGDNFAYTDTSELEFGIASRSYPSFRAAAEENNWARFYGGIHFHHSCLISTEYGRKVGDYVVQKVKLKKN